MIHVCCYALLCVVMWWFEVFYVHAINMKAVVIAREKHRTVIAGLCTLNRYDMFYV